MPTLRLATLEDASALARVHIAAWRETYLGLLPDSLLAALSVEDRTAAWIKNLDNAAKGPTTVYVVENDAELVGFGVYGPQRTPHLKHQGYCGEIEAIYLLRAHQGTGTGSRLLKLMLANLARSGYRGVSLWVLQGNVVAQQFYEHKGAVRIAEREDNHRETILKEIAYGWPHLGDQGHRL